jgi:hypothetical protein
VELVLAILIVVAVAAFVSVPLRRSRRDRDAAGPVATADPELAALDARKQAKYREIGDTELDRAQGKLTEPDFRRQQAELRADAISILKQIDARERALEVERPDDGENQGSG